MEYTRLSLAGRIRQTTAGYCRLNVRRKEASIRSTRIRRTLDIRHAGCALVLEAQHDGCRVSSGNLFGDRPEAGVGCCQRPFLIHRNTDEKAPLVVGVCLLTTNELNARMRKWMAAFVDHLTRPLCPWAWRLEGDAFADCARRKRSINIGPRITTDANMITADQLEAAKLEVDSVSAIRQPSNRYDPSLPLVVCLTSPPDCGIVVTLRPESPHRSRPEQRQQYLLIERKRTARDEEN